MARHKDKNWNLPDLTTSDHATVALLMDLRDELKQLNRHIIALRTGETAANIARIDRRLAEIAPLPRGRKPAR